MKKIVIGCLLMQLIVFEPIIGYQILRVWLHIDDTPIIVSTVAYVVTSVIQLFFYVPLITKGYQELNIKTVWTEEEQSQPSRYR